MFRPITLLAIFIVSFALVGQALGDGKVFSKHATAKVNIPDQEALIHFADGVETMVIQTSFTGEGDEFAWVVPTPSKPEVTASTTGLFPTLRKLTAPTIRNPRYEFYLLAWLVALLVLGGLGGRFIEMFFVLSVVLLLLGILLPSLGAARGIATVAGTEVHQRTIVGDYEIAVLSADDPSSLTAWLDDNGFKTSAQTDEVIQHYTDEGWFLTAARLTPKATLDGKASTHPIAFRFPVKEPIYPLRLTATGSDALDVDLYIFGPERASIDGFDVAFCNRLAYPPAATRDDWLDSSDSAETAIRHPELISRVHAAAFVTKLSANLSPSDMSQDAAIRWDGEKTYTPVRWTDAGVRNIAVNVGWSCLAFVVMSLPFVFPKGAWYKLNKGKASRLALIGAIASVVFAGAVYMALPKTDANIISRPRMHWRALEHKVQNVVQTVEDPSGVADAVDELLAYPRLINPSTGGAIQLGDSSGNFTYEWTDNGLVITIYGPDGAPLRIRRIYGRGRSHV